MVSKLTRILQIFEQSQFASEYGAAIHIQPNANGILKRLGVFLEESGANSLDWVSLEIPCYWFLSDNLLLILFEDHTHFYCSLANRYYFI